MGQLVQAQDPTGVVSDATIATQGDHDQPHTLLRHNHAHVHPKADDIEDSLLGHETPSNDPGVVTPQGDSTTPTMQVREPMTAHHGGRSFEKSPLLLLILVCLHWVIGTGKLRERSLPRCQEELALKPDAKLMEDPDSSKRSMYKT